MEESESRHDPLQGIYNGEIPDVQDRVRQGIDEEEIINLWKESKENGVELTRTKKSTRVGFKNGKVVANLRPDISPEDALHELVHVQQYLESIRSGVPLNALEQSIPPVTRAIIEIEATDAELVYLRSKLNSPQETIEGVRQHQEVWKKRLTNLGFEVPEKRIPAPFSPGLELSLKRIK
jgi:hypothetical protein